MKFFSEFSDEKTLMKVYSEDLGNVDDVSAYLQNINDAYQKLLIFFRICEGASRKLNEKNKFIKERAKWETIINEMRKIVLSQSTTIKGKTIAGKPMFYFQKLVKLYPPPERKKAPEGIEYDIYELIKDFYSRLAIIDEEKLKINRILFKSPGWIEYIGIHIVCVFLAEGIAILIKELINYYNNKNKRNFSKKRLEKSLLNTKLSKSAKKLFLDFGWKENEILDIIDLFYIKPLINLYYYAEKGIITNIEIIATNKAATDHAG